MLIHRLYVLTITGQEPRPGTRTAPRSRGLGWVLTVSGGRGRRRRRRTRRLATPRKRTSPARGPGGGRRSPPGGGRVTATCPRIRTLLHLLVPSHSNDCLRYRNRELCGDVQSHVTVEHLTRTFHSVIHRRFSSFLSEDSVAKVERVREGSGDGPCEKE